VTLAVVCVIPKLYCFILVYVVPAWSIYSFGVLLALSVEPNSLVHAIPVMLHGVFNTVCSSVRSTGYFPHVYRVGWPTSYVNMFVVLYGLLHMLTCLWCCMAYFIC
jgi:hypothetical protein